MHLLTNKQLKNNTRPAFLDYQQQFSDYLRNPQIDESLPALLRVRISVYANLLHNKIDSSLCACFPIARELLEDTIWHSLVNDFIQRHHCQSPLYREIPDEFIAYLMHEKPLIELPDFIVDLAHYEWMELILETERPSSNPEYPSGDDLLSTAPMLNPVLHLLHYRYPVHLISPDDDYWKNWQQRSTPYAQAAVILAGIRDTDYNIHFIELNTVAENPGNGALAK